MVCSLRCVYNYNRDTRQKETRLERKKKERKKKKRKKKRKKEREKFKNTKKTEVDERLSNYLSLFVNLVYVDFFVCFIFVELLLLQT